ncbi:MAG: hypothetical protein QXJ51_05810 [Sulfolobales archaeon]
MNDIGSHEVMIEIMGSTNEIFYQTLRNAIEASRILRLEYEKKVVAVPVFSLLEDLYDFSSRSVYIKIDKRIYKKYNPPPVEWFIKNILEKNSEGDPNIEPEISGTSDEKFIYQAQECVI